MHPALKELLEAKIADSRVRVTEALTEALVENAKEEPENDVILGHILDAMREMDRGESLAEVFDLEKEVAPS